MTEYWNYIVTFVGLVGFWLAGKKIWWCWYVNIFNQILWFTFGLVTEQWGFVVGSLFYTAVFGRNAYRWTREHFHKGPKLGEKIGEVTKIEETDDGLLVTGRIYPNAGDIFASGAFKGYSIDRNEAAPIIDWRKEE